MKLRHKLEVGSGAGTQTFRYITMAVGAVIVKEMVQMATIPARRVAEVFSL
jgi:hypothetical protein